MNDAEQKVLTVLAVPLTHVEIARQTGLPRNVVKAAVGRLKKRGVVISYGSTAAVRVMTLRVACDALCHRLGVMAVTLGNVRGNLKETLAHADALRSIYGSLKLTQREIDGLDKDLAPLRRIDRSRDHLRCAQTGNLGVGAV